MLSVTKTTRYKDESIEWSRLDINDLCNVAEAITAEWERKARKLAVEEKLTKDTLNHLVLNIRSRMPSVEEMGNLSQSPQGARLFLRESAKKAKIEKSKAEEIITSMSVAQIVDLAYMLVMDVQEEKVEELPLTSASPDGSTTGPVE